MVIRLIWIQSREGVFLVSHILEFCITLIYVGRRHWGPTMSEVPIVKRRGRRDRKDKVLHTRIPRQLDQYLKEHAEDLGLSVSSMVRNVLLNSFSLVEGVVMDSASLALGQSRSAPQDVNAPDLGSSQAVLGWQALTLNVNAVCHQCNDLMPKGSAGGLGVPTSERPLFLCGNCLAQLQDSTTRSKESQATRPKHEVSHE